ncbi:hypothetical protein A2368_02090 [Candidatus Collierbacteria bacterium RIFOXYB1_FULL_49_13]|uniref:Uncharacterized protein n=1 Tax=Candidatus Collierbacteria bacterium RIFOXYB1_FULL_49_13 TaxID=1817728 RepID=A0A1F5FGG3_9BACT|nr:MAG: hypothetical protein A2368_02090 [Candidatus Collierbacteria bacterium RIFOXYB1_FULL_49_13]
MKTVGDCLLKESHINKKIRAAVIDVGTLKSKFEVREYDNELNSQVICRMKELTTKRVDW